MSLATDAAVIISAIQRNIMNLFINIVIAYVSTKHEPHNNGGVLEFIQLGSIW